MGEKVYPRIKETTRLKGTRPCTIDGAPATRRVWVQTWYMRGDDEEAFLCDQCWPKHDPRDPDYNGLAKVLLASLNKAYKERTQK